jgi:hypothetical protein
VARARLCDDGPIGDARASLTRIDARRTHHTWSTEMKTAGVKKLVNTALGTLPKPYGEDVIEEVFIAIENDEALKAEYDALSRELGKTTVNTWGGYWIANAVGKTGVQQTISKRSTLLQSYSKLTAPGVAAGKKRKEAEALQVMSDYYQQNKARLSPSIRNYRHLLIDMLVEGLPVEEAFAMAPMEPAEPQTPAQRRR